MLDELVGHSLLAVQHSEGEDAAPTATRFALDESIRAYAAATLDAGAARALRVAAPPLARRLGPGAAGHAAAGAAARRAAQPRGGAALGARRRRARPKGWRRWSRCAAACRTRRCRPRCCRCSRPRSPAPPTRPSPAAATPCSAACISAPARGAAARRHADRGLLLARALPAATPERDELLARALQTAASVAWRTLRDAAAAEALLDESEPLAARSGDLGAQASADALRAFIANVAHRDLARAESLHGQALRRWEQAGDALSANTGRYNLAVCALRGRRFEEVLARLADIAREAERLHDWRLLSQARNVAGEAETGRRDWAAAAAAYRDEPRARLERAGPALVRLRALEPALSAGPAAPPRAGGAARRRRAGLLGSAHRRPR